MSNASIRSTFMQTLATWASAHNPVITIAREDAPFTKPTGDTPFIEAILIPARTQVSTLSAGSNKFVGTFVMNIWCRSGLGPGVAENLVEELSALFPVVPKPFYPIHVETPLSAARAISDVSGYRVTPTSFTYYLKT